MIVKLFHYSLSTLLLGMSVAAVLLVMPNAPVVEDSNSQSTSKISVNIVEGLPKVSQTEEIGIDQNLIRSSDLVDVGVGNVPDSLKSYIYEYKGRITFKGGDIVFPKTKEAIQRAYSSVGDALTVCKDGKCFNKCDHLAGDIWGYDDASGYYSATTHWQAALDTGIAKVKDREPPLGALLFWSSINSDFGHVATYIGNGLVVTNSGGEYGSNVYIYYADWYENNGRDYWGWAPPVFFGESPGSAL
jgi:hypothetical protein